MNEELQEQIKEYIKNNLSIAISEVNNYYESENKYYKIELILDGETISCACT